MSYDESVGQKEQSSRSHSAFIFYFTKMSRFIIRGIISNSSPWDHGNDYEKLLKYCNILSHLYTISFFQPYILVHLIDSVLDGIREGSRIRNRFVFHSWPKQNSNSVTYLVSKCIAVCVACVPDSYGGTHFSLQWSIPLLSSFLCQHRSVVVVPHPLLYLLVV